MRLRPRDGARSPSVMAVRNRDLVGGFLLNFDDDEIFHHRLLSGCGVRDRLASNHVLRVGYPKYMI